MESILKFSSEIYSKILNDVQLCVRITNLSKSLQVDDEDIWQGAEAEGLDGTQLGLAATWTEPRVL